MKLKELLLQMYEGHCERLPDETDEDYLQRCGNSMFSQNYTATQLSNIPNVMKHKLVVPIKSKQMLKESVYAKAAENFGTPVGVAHIIGYKNKKQQIEEEGIESFNSIQGELQINAIISDAIELELYQELQRVIYRLKGNKRIKKETTIYNKAWKEITKNENYITKSGQIF